MRKLPVQAKHSEERGKGEEAKWSNSVVDIEGGGWSD